MDEKNLALRAADGDKEAFAALYTLYKDRLYRYACFKLGDPEDARDAVSACVVAAFENIRSLRSASAFGQWIFRILYRCCLRLITEQLERRERADISELERLPAAGEGISPELSEAFSVLSPQDRDIVLLSAIAGCSSREIAAVTGLKPATVRSRLSRALAKMKKFLE